MINGFKDSYVLQTRMQAMYTIRIDERRGGGDVHKFAIF